MNEHLYAAILAHIDCCVLIDALRLSRTEVGDHHIEGLLIVFHELRLCGVLHTRDTRRQDIVDRCLVIVFLDINSTDSHVTRVGCAVGEILRINAPLTPNQVEATKPEHNRFLEIGEEHTHETYGSEVADRTYFLLISIEWDAELIPCNIVAFTVSECTTSHSAINNEVFPHNKILGSDRDMVLVVFFVLVERVILIDILDIGRSLIRCVVTLTAVI